MSAHENSCHDFRHDDAAYLLGALDPAQAAAYEAHLRDCAACREGLEELRPTLALLAAAGPDLIEDEPPPDTLLAGLLRRAARERARRRILTGGLAGLAAACLVTLVVALWPSSASDPKPPAQAFAAVRATPVTATAQLVDRRWGTQIDLKCKYARAGLPPVAYRLVVVDVDDRRHNVGGWTLVAGTTDFVGGTEVRRDRIARVEVTLPDGSAILQLTP